MKKSLLILSAVLLGLSITTFGFMNWGPKKAEKVALSCNASPAPNYDLNYILNTPAEVDLVYLVEPRFKTRVSREKVLQAQSIKDILPWQATGNIAAFQEVEVAILNDDGTEPKIELGMGDKLNPAQTRLLQTIHYSTNIYIEANYKVKSPKSGELAENYLTYYISIIPEQEAQYADGYDALIGYLKASSKAYTSIITKDKLKPGTVHFTVSENGSIEGVRLSASCGFPSVDEVLVEAIQNMPGKWQAATNGEGEAVSQELVFFFGLEGC